MIADILLARLSSSVQVEHHTSVSTQSASPFEGLLVTETEGQPLSSPLAEDGLLIEEGPLQSMPAAIGLKEAMISPEEERLVQDEEAIVEEDLIAFTVSVPELDLPLAPQHVPLQFSRFSFLEVESVSEPAPVSQEVITLEEPIPAIKAPLEGAHSSSSPAASPEVEPLTLNESATDFNQLLLEETREVKDVSNIAPKEEPKSTKADMPPLVRNVFDRMQELNLAEGRTTLLLKPHGLGLLEIDMSAGPDGRMNLVIRVENPLILDALRQESTALSLFMGGKGFDLSGGEPQLAQYERPKPSTSAALEDQEPEEDAIIADQLANDGLNIVT